MAGVDRLLTRAHGLFPVSGGSGGGVFAAGGGEAPSVPDPPAGSGLSGGAGAAGASYGQAAGAVDGVDVDTAGVAAAGGATADAGRAGSGAIRDQARAVGAVSAPLGSSAAGAQLVVATMDQHLEAMQRQLDQTTAQNRLLALRLRELAAAYRVGGGGGGSPLSALSGLSMPGLGGLGGGGGLSGLSGLAGLPASFLGNHARLAAATTSQSGSQQQALGAAGIAAGAIPLSEVSFEGKGVWPGGRGAIEHYLEESLDRLGITDPRARANWMAGMLTIAEHESTWRTDAINLKDSNAHGPHQVDGGPLHSTRGPFQVEPGTFASHHQPGTSNHVWDPVASGCAAINYVMSRYGVARDGHNLRALVGQANPGVHHGY